MHCMAMLSYPCMEESCVCTVPASHLIVCHSATYNVVVELTVELSKQKRKQAPTVNSSILLTLFQMNGYLHVAKRFEAVRKI